MEKHITKENPCGAPVKTFFFEFGTDEGNYFVSFKGIIPEEEIKHILDAAHTQLYIKCAEAIHSYLDTRHLEYSDFTSGRTRLEHNIAMKAADSLLNDDACIFIDKQACDTNAYYAIMDYQSQNDNGCREGCYYAVSRTLTRQKCSYEYHIICQTFQYGEAGSNEHACFAIRRKEGGNYLRTLDQADGRPVLATFGCVDMLRLLVHIQSITTKQQAADLANR